VEKLTLSVHVSGQEFKLPEQQVVLKEMRRSKQNTLLKPFADEFSTSWSINRKEISTFVLIKEL